MQEAPPSFKAPGLRGSVQLLLWALCTAYLPPSPPGVVGSQDPSGSPTVRAKPALVSSIVPDKVGAAMLYAGKGQLLV